MLNGRYIAAAAAATQKNQCWGDWPNGEEVNTNHKKTMKKCTYAQNEDDDDDGNRVSGERERER